MTDSADNKPSQLLFWGCFIALITTSFGFITRMFLFDDPEIVKLLNLDPAEVGKAKGIQIWPFAISIILFSLIIDKVGYKFSMIFAAACQIIWAIMGIVGLGMAQSGDVVGGAKMIYWGGLILALGNGTVEAFINPVVATMFTKDKTKWLNILHAGWPGGLVIAGIIVIFMGEDASWQLKLGIIIIPAVIYLLMLIKENFPVQERVASGVSYKDMLSEFGVFGALVVAVLIYLQLDTEFPGQQTLFLVLCIGFVAFFGVYTQSLGRGLMGILILIMMPLATTEIGTDGWISGIMADAVSFHAGWILVYTSVIMMGLRFLAGPIVHALNPLPLLILSSVLAIAGLWALAATATAGATMIFVAATLYAVGKSFFWPTMLGIVSEQTPKGGALTLNAVSGIGMLAVGVLGFPFIGAIQANKEISEVANTAVPALVENGQVVSDAKEGKDIYQIIKYEVLSEDAVTTKLADADQDTKDKVATARKDSGPKALATMTVFPLSMLIAYIAIYMYFRNRGGYKPIELDGGDGSSAPSGGDESPAPSGDDESSSSDD
ncbi:MAG: MFS transporter [Verrucomicrobiota bacterium]|nr:MFS transporter [Verrucomicrobiota bacterium]